MKSLLLLLLFVCNAIAADVYVGFVSDSGCALARASAGKYTPTNPDCARRCVQEGKKIVLISPNEKQVFSIENPAALKSQIGSKVRVYASKTGPQTLHVEKVDFLEAITPECERPPLKN